MTDLLTHLPSHTPRTAGSDQTSAAPDTRQPDGAPQARQNEDSHPFSRELSRQMERQRDAREQHEQHSRTSETQSNRHTTTSPSAEDKKKTSEPDEEPTVGALQAAIQPRQTTSDPALNGNDAKKAATSPATVTQKPIASVTVDTEPAKAALSQQIEAEISEKAAFSDKLNQQLLKAFNQSGASSNSPMQTALMPGAGPVSQPSGHSAALTAPTVQTPLSPSAAWGQDFSQKVSWIATQRLQSAELQLNPANLGPVNISLKVSEDNSTTIQFSSPHAAVREAIESSLPRLRETLAENGINLGNTSVNDQSAQQKEQQQRSAFSHAQNRTSGDDSADSDQELMINGMPARATVTTHNGLLDTFA